MREDDRGRDRQPADMAAQVSLRNQLANLLAEAAEIEHDLLCQYLFAAFSLKRYPEEGVSWAQLEMMRRWAGTLMLVARQEMEHLGLVCNLLTAIGEAPNFRRPAFPIRRDYYPTGQPSELKRFDRDVLLSFVCYEMPRAISPEDWGHLARYIPGFSPEQYDGLFRLYGQIERLFTAIDPAVLFIGPPSAQFLSSSANSPFSAASPRGRTFAPNPKQLPSIYDVSLRAVTDRASALEVVRQIVDEGEGADEHSTTSHFARFIAMHREYCDELQADPGFTPGRAVVANPRLADGEPGAGTPITDERTAQVMRLFNLCYETMLIMLARYFSDTDEGPADMVALGQVVFFPMMTIIMRPLGEVLTQLPAFADDDGARAGPAFSFDRRLALLPHRQAAWRNIQMQLSLMGSLSEELARASAFPATIAARLQLVYENIARIQMNFNNAMVLRGFSNEQ